MVSNPHKKGQLTEQESSSTQSTEESGDSDGETNSDGESMHTINSDKSKVEDYAEDISTKPIKEKPNEGKKKLITYFRKKKTSEAPATRRAIESIRGKRERSPIELEFMPTKVSSIEPSPTRKKTRIIDPHLRTRSNGKMVNKFDRIGNTNHAQGVTSRKTGSPVSSHIGYNLIIGNSSWGEERSR